MIGNHVPKGTGPLIISPPLFHTYCLCSCDLHVVNILPVPDRFEDPVSETECNNVLYSFFAKVMVNPIDLLFMENFFNFLIEGTGSS